MGYEGFSGNESILYHLQSPCRVTELGRSSRSSATSGCPTRTRTGSLHDVGRRAGRRPDQRPPRC